MKRIIIFGLLLISLLVTGSIVLAQTEEPEGVATTSNPSLEIAWPTPISEVWGPIEIMGTASVPEFAFYRLEMIPLDEQTLSPVFSVGWIPITVDFTEPVVNGVLASVDTATIPDGLYGLRLVVGVGDAAAPSQLFQTVTGPIRVSNGQYLEGTESEEAAPPPPELESDQPYVVTNPGVTAVNVRYCDQLDSERCPVIDVFDSTEGAALLGLSANDSGWYLVETGSGLQGWVQPINVEVVGDTGNVPLVAPPQPIEVRPSQPPVPITTEPSIPAVPLQLSKASPNGVAVVDALPQCGRSFTVHINMSNPTNQVSRGGTVILQNIHRGSGKVTGVSVGSYPEMPPGGNYVVPIKMKVNRYNSRGQELVATAEGRSFSTKYDIDQGKCRKASDSSKSSSRAIEVDFAPGECVVTPKKNAPQFSFPNGPRVGKIFSGDYDAVKASRVNKRIWYMIAPEPDTGNSPTWVRDKDIRRVQGCKI
ncbi:MAG: hypothetical protein KDJ65_30005 [Anaerolineae bacterium]|nr:hypothetical protein [Anaerolineae bacterium]